MKILHANPSNAIVLLTLKELEFICGVRIRTQDNYGRDRLNTTYIEKLIEDDEIIDLSAHIERHRQIKSLLAAQDKVVSEIQDLKERAENITWPTIEYKRKKAQS